MMLRAQMFRLWRSPAEPAVMSNDPDQDGASSNPIEQAQQPDRTANTSSTSNPSSSTTAAATRSHTASHHHSISIPFHNNSHSSLLTHGTCGSLATHLDASQAAYGARNVLGGTKLWQSLVLPMVLACVIFLVALWARQISRALTNDAIVLMLVMVCIFVVMSAIAFWLSCDHFFKSESAHADSLASRGPSPLTDDNFPPQHAMCPHHQHHFQHQQSTSNSRQQHQAHCPHADCQMAAGEHHMRVARSRAEKCCHISVIDCQPPDYHSALLHSVPIQQYLMFGQDDEELNVTHQTQFATLHVVGIDGDSILSGGNEDEHSERGDSRKGSPEMGAKQLYLFPPSYEELSKK